MKKIRLSLLAALRRAKRSGNACPLVASIAKGICLGLIAFNLNPHQVAAAENTGQYSSQDRSLHADRIAGVRPAVKTQSAVAPPPKRANFGREHKSDQVRHVADWVVDSSDNRSLPFVIVDKAAAKVFVFDASGRLRGGAPALLGLARGDYAVPGIGDRKLSDIRPEERTTPAGRFVASMGFNAKEKDVLWVDSKDAVSLHRVITNNPEEHRLERLASPTPMDHRISYGCINVPAKFFDNVVKPTFTGTSGIVYVLPDVRPVSEIFRSYYDVDSGRGKNTTASLYEHTLQSLQAMHPAIGRGQIR